MIKAGAFEAAQQQRCGGDAPPPTTGRQTAVNTFSLVDVGV